MCLYEECEFNYEIEGSLAFCALMLCRFLLVSCGGTGSSVKRSINWSHPIPSIGLGRQTTTTPCCFCVQFCILSVLEVVCMWSVSCLLGCCVCLRGG